MRPETVEILERRIDSSPQEASIHNVEIVGFTSKLSNYQTHTSDRDTNVPDARRSDVKTTSAPGGLLRNWPLSGVFIEIKLVIRRVCTLSIYPIVDRANLF